jgi:hypothetical protein
MKICESFSRCPVRDQDIDYNNPEKIAMDFYQEDFYQ